MTKYAHEMQNVLFLAHLWFRHQWRAFRATKIQANKIYKKMLLVGGGRWAPFFSAIVKKSPLPTKSICGCFAPNGRKIFLAIVRPDDSRKYFAPICRKAPTKRHYIQVSYIWWALLSFCGCPQKSKVPISRINLW